MPGEFKVFSIEVARSTLPRLFERGDQPSLEALARVVALKMVLMRHGVDG